MIYYRSNSHAGSGFTLLRTSTCELRLEHAMSGYKDWIDRPTEVDFYKGIIENAPGAKESAMTYAAIGLGALYGVKKVKKKKKK